jgi:valyl-tRNA synthetase
VIWSFAYPFADGSGEIVVATTRPETMLGDTAVAVHPDDPRYAHCHGKALRHPFLPDRALAVVCDGTLVDMAYGTGAVKVTPAHDANDFACGQRLGLAQVTILTDEGTMNEEAGEFAGQKRFDCRFNLLAALKEQGLFRGEVRARARSPLASRSLCSLCSLCALFALCSLFALFALCSLFALFALCSLFALFALCSLCALFLRACAR